MRLRKRVLLLLAIPVGLGALLLLLLILAWKGMLPGTQNRFPILMYHNIVPDGEKTNDMTVTVSRLRDDLTWLKQHGYTTVLPRELAAGKPLPKKAVMITFDDGYASNYTYAFPLLRERNMKAAIALVGKVLDGGSPSILSWDMCREMQDSGLIEFGSHTYDLHNLDERDGLYIKDASNGIQRVPGENQADYEARVFPDLERSIQQLEQNLGTSITYLAYPFGATDPWADDFIQKHFAVTTTTIEGTADLSDGFYNLPRKTVTNVYSAENCLSFWDFLRELKHSLLDDPS